MMHHEYVPRIMWTQLYSIYARIAVHPCARGLLNSGKIVGQAIKNSSKVGQIKNMKHVNK